jgi:hypothetical protein
MEKKGKKGKNYKKDTGLLKGVRLSKVLLVSLRKGLKNK